MACNGNGIVYDSDGDMVNCPGCSMCRGREEPPPPPPPDDDD